MPGEQMLQKFNHFKKGSAIAAATNDSRTEGSS